MQIRKATKDDFDHISSLMNELNPRDAMGNIDVRKNVFNNIIDDSNNHIFVGIIENIPVSTCYLNVIPNITWNAAPYALIENVVTLELQRRKGYGRQCIQHAIDYAFSNGCFKVLLMSSQRNDRTIAFYASVGLEQSKDGYVIYKNFI